MPFASKNTPAGVLQPLVDTLQEGLGNPNLSIWGLHPDERGQTAAHHFGGTVDTLVQPVWVASGRVGVLLQPQVAAIRAEPTVPVNVLVVNVAECRDSHPTFFSVYHGVSALCRLHLTLTVWTVHLVNLVALDKRVWCKKVGTSDWDLPLPWNTRYEWRSKRQSGTRTGTGSPWPV